MDARNDGYTELLHIIREETKLLRHYMGKVTDDAGEKGEVMVTISEWGEDSGDAFWAWPREKNIQVPKVDSYVEVYFMNGDINRPVYLGLCNEVTDQMVKSFDGKVKTSVLFEDNKDDKNCITYDADEKEFKVGSEKITLLDGDQFYVLGDKLKTQLQKIIDQLTQLRTDFSTWTPVPNDGGAALKGVVSAGFALKPDASLTDILSEKIKGK